MTKTRLGFIGVGGIARRHLDVLSGFEDVELAAYASPTIARAQDAALRFGGKAFSDFRDMLDDAPLDAVYICVPPAAHGEIEREVIARHLPFFIEKPVTIDLDLAEEISEAITRQNLTVSVGYHWRYLTSVDEARALLAGNPAHLVTGAWIDQTPPPQWWWHQETSGGQMLEQATHIVDLARYLVGDINRVYGMAAHRARPDFGGLDVETAETASLSFVSGAIGTIGSTCLLRGRQRVGLDIVADGLAIELTENSIMVSRDGTRPVRPVTADPFVRENRDFIDAVRGGENRIRSPYRDALETHRAVVAINRSAQSRKPVTLGGAPDID